MMFKKYGFKAALRFTVPITIAFSVQKLLQEPHLTAIRITIIIVSALIGAAVGGLIGELMLSKTLSSKFIQKATAIQTNADEFIVFETAANHWKGYEAVGGKLYLTNKRLVYKSHKLNIQNHELSINLDKIEYAERYKTFGIINNGLSIYTTENTTEKFVVKEANEWMENLAQIKGGLALSGY